MPWTLYRYILKDLVRLLLLSLAVVVLVLSFAAVVKPLSDGLLDPVRLLKLVAFTMPIVLVLVAPFASAFASTIVFCRMASDNEIVACSAGGISYRVILLPVFLFGLVLTISLYVLSNWVVPSFYRRAELAIQRDVTQVVVAAVKRGRPVALPGNENWVLYADAADLIKIDAAVESQGVRPYQRISFVGLAMGRFDVERKIREQLTAQQADLFVFRHQGRTWAHIRLKNSTRYDPRSGSQQFFKDFEIRDLPVASPIEDDPRFLTRRQLAVINANPDRYDSIARRKRKLAMRMARQTMLKSMAERLSGPDHGGVMLQDEAGQHYVVLARLIDRDAKHLRLTAGERAPIRVNVVQGGVPMRTYEATSALIAIDTGQELFEPQIELELEDVTIRDFDRNRTSQKQVYLFRRLQWDEPLARPLINTPSDELLATAAHLFSDVAAVKTAAHQLGYHIQKIRRKIFAQSHERFALALCGLLVLMLGAVLSMQMRGSMPLAVYFWVFLLASLAVFITRSGENVASKPEHAFGLAMLTLWIGNIGLAAAAALIYAKLVKN